MLGNTSREAHVKLKQLEDERGMDTLVKGRRISKLGDASNRNLCGLVKVDRQEI